MHMCSKWKDRIVRKNFFHLKGYELANHYKTTKKKKKNK
jgi:hypothetical protein